MRYSCRRRDMEQMKLFSTPVLLNRKEKQL